MWPTIYDEDQNKVYDLPSRLLKDRIILLCEPINSETSTSIVSQLLYLDSIAPGKEITMYINSPGGSVSDGFAIADTINAISSPVRTICNGMAASMGAFLLCSGSNGLREAMPNSCIMIHQPLGGAQGQATEIEIAAKRIMHLKKKLYEIMMANTGRTYEEIEKACERDNYLTPQEALSFGLIDTVIELPNKATTKE